MGKETVAFATRVWKIWFRLIQENLFVSSVRTSLNMRFGSPLTERSSKRFCYRHSLGKWLWSQARESQNNWGAMTTRYSCTRNVALIINSFSGTLTSMFLRPLLVDGISVFFHENIFEWRVSKNKIIFEEQCRTFRGTYALTHHNLQATGENRCNALASDLHFCS